MNDRADQVRRLVLTAVEGCAKCGQAYAADHIDLIGQRGDMWMFRICCPACRKLGFIAALVNTDEAASATMVQADEERFDGLATPVTGRDVLEMHEYLATLRGGLSLPERPA
jgi:hypothetical protein